jgi:hypothetical protein
MYLMKGGKMQNSARDRVLDFIRERGAVTARELASFAGGRWDEVDATVALAKLCANREVWPKTAAASAEVFWCPWEKRNYAVARLRGDVEVHSSMATFRRQILEALEEEGDLGLKVVQIVSAVKAPHNKVRLSLYEMLYEELVDRYEAADGGAFGRRPFFYRITDKGHDFLYPGRS